MSRAKCPVTETARPKSRVPVHVYDVALCGNTARNVTFGHWLVGHPCFRSCYLARNEYLHPSFRNIVKGGNL